MIGYKVHQTMGNAVVTINVETPHPCPAIERVIGGPPRATKLNLYAKACCVVGSTVVLCGIAAIATSTTSDELSPLVKGAICTAAGALITCGCCFCGRLAKVYRNAHNAIQRQLATDVSDAFGGGYEELSENF